MIMFFFLFPTPQTLADVALDKAIEAAYIQTGLQGDVALFENYCSAKGTLYVNRWGVAKPLAIGLFTYRTIKHKELALRINSNKKLKLTTNSIGVEWNL